ncbi:MAG: response regulator [Gemmatimonadota bacterium]|nr:response regulator [Gemmatimonadota bacterium]MDH3479106.1 response regulator [Gemmatimonadota bacterium]MDH5550428.1 response regulator [Gemmatimonadota bacterium]
MTHRPVAPSADERLEVVGELATLINTTYDLNEIFRSAILELRRVLAFRRASVTLASNDRTHYSLHTLYDAARGGFQVVQKAFPIDSGLPGRAIQTGEAMRVDDFAGTEGIRQEQERTISALIVPLRVGNQVIGSLNFGAPESVLYDDEDLELAVLLGKQIETSLHYSKLLATIHKQREQLEREHAKARLQQTRLEALIEAGESAILMVGRGKVVHANRAMAELLGLPREVVLDASMEQLHRALGRSLRDPAMLTAQEAAMLTDGTPLRDRVEFVFPRAMTCQRTVDPVLSRYGEVMGHLVVYQDVTRAAEAEAAKDEFVSMVSHELRTPLTSVKTSLALLSRGAAGEVTDAMAGFVTIALRNLDRLIRLVDDLLDLSRIESGRLVTHVTATPLDDVARHAVEMVRGFADDRRVTLDWQSDGEGPLVLVDAARLEQVIVNLLSNAIKFSPEGGHVGFRWFEQPGAIVAEVSDEGPGIPAELLRAVFDKFRQLDHSSTRMHGGVGLGLYISRAIIEQLSGELWAESSEGRGTRFYVRVPRAEAPIAAPVVAAGAASAVRRVVLLVPDPDLALLIRTELEQESMEVEERSRGSEALELLQQWVPDAVVAHIGLDDMHGLEFIRRLREQPQTTDLPTVLVGGDIPPAQAIAYGADAWIPADAGGVLQEILRIGGAPRRPIVLLIEDDPAQRGALARLIRRQGLAVVEAADGTAGLELARRRPPRAVVTDYQLPGMNGLDVLRAMRADPALASVPALLIGGQGAPQTQRDAKTLGADFLSKPMDWMVIAEAVATLVGADPVSREADTEP